MKTRKGFVTNSSSSSFILHFYRDEDETVEEAIRESLGWDMGLYKKWVYKRLLNDIKANLLTRQQVIDRIKDEVMWEVIREIKDEFYVKYVWNSELEDFVFVDRDGNNVSEKYEAILDERATQKAEEYIWWKDSDRHIFAEVEYGSDISSETADFEHRLMPNLDCVVHQFSHHQGSSK